MPAVATLDDMADQTNEILLSGTPAQRKAEPHGRRFRPRRDSVSGQWQLACQRLRRRSWPVAIWMVRLRGRWPLRMASR